MKNLKLIGVALASIAATAAFILSCGSGPKTAAAQSCARWEVSLFSVFPDQPNCGGKWPTYPDTCGTPPGWEIVGAMDSDTVLLRRCAP
jgi:hypothetical protein